MQNAWNKYGEENFKFYTIEICDNKILDEREKYYINLYLTLIDGFGYNLDSGGTLNKLHAQETKDKIRKSNSGKTTSVETREKISKNRTGKCVGEDHFMYGKHLSDEVKSKLSNKITGMFSGDKHYDANYYNTNDVNISKCCKCERKSSGALEDGTPLQWANYDKDKTYVLEQYNRGTNAKLVYQYDLNNEFIAVFESARDAEKQTGIGHKMISRVCNDERRQTHGYIFKFYRL